MKSIKPGRGPSMMSAIICIAVAIFGVIWTISAFSMGAGSFSLFGVVFIIIAIIQAIYNFKNATGKNRYSTFDITDEDEEIDPLNELFKSEKNESFKKEYSSAKSNYCPYCGIKTESDHEFCKNCGKKL